MAEHATEEYQDTGLHAQELCRQFLAVARKKLTGTLVVTTADGIQKSFLCHNGTIADLDTGTEHSLLTQVILLVSEVSSRQLKKAQKTAEKNGTTVGTVLMEMELVPEEELLKAIEETVTEEVTDVFSREIEHSGFVSHEADETIEGFQSELSDFFDLTADPETLFLEAAQRLERWDLVRECFDLLLDVFYATPGTFSYFREPETYPAEIRVLGAIDGTNDVEEVIHESGLDPFTAIEVLRNLVRDGAIELINPVQMFQLGQQAAADENMDKACRLYRRAKERGLNDFDIELRLAHCLESLGRKKEAAASYFEFSEKCLNQLRVDEAIRSLRRVVKLSPDQIEAMSKLLDLLVQHNRLDEAFEVAMSFSMRLESRGDPGAALEMLLPLRDTGIREVRLHERIIELAERCEEHDLARTEKELVDQTFHERRDAAEALESYQKLFCEGNDTLEVRLKLVQLHREQGNRQKAVDHINSILSMGGRKRVKDTETLLELHEAMRELQPADVRSNRWLFEHYLKNGEKDRAAEVLKTWLPELQKAGDYDELVNALKQLIALEDHLQYRWTLAAVLQKLHRQSESCRELRNLAHHAMRGRKFDEAARALEHILKTDPLDTETRKAQAELYDMRGDKEVAAEKLKELATLEIISGNILEAEVYCRQYLISTPDNAEIVDKFGNLCLERGDRQKAVEQLLKAAKIHLENRDLGLARRTLERLLKAQPKHGEASKLFERLEELEARLAAGPAKEPAKGPAKELKEKEKPKETKKKKKASPPPATGPSPALTSKREPFQGVTPVKTTVSGITARLRKLKSDDSPKTKGRSAAAVGDIAARLKSLKGAGGQEGSTGSPGGEASAAPPPGEPSGGTADAGNVGANPRLQGIQLAGGPVPRVGTKEIEPVPTPSVALKSAAARLKALSAKSTTPAAGPKPPSPVMDPSPDPQGGPESETEGPEAAASAGADDPRMALEGKSTTKPAERRDTLARAVSASAEAPPGADDETTMMPEAGADGAPGAAPAAARLRKKLKSSASRLAELRKRKDG